MRPLILLAVSLTLVACKESPRPAPAQATRVGADGPARMVKLDGLVRPAPSMMPAAERADTAWAEAERLATAAAWDAAAERYAELVRRCKAPSDECREVAYAMVLARKNAMAADPVETTDPTRPTPLPARVEAFVDACDAYANRTTSSDPELPGLQFLAASEYRKFGLDDDAIPRFEALVSTFPEHEVAEYAANLMLDALNRAGKYDELKRWAAQLLGQDALLSGKPDLRRTLERIVAAR
jgi:tetratricopeptide (TPR) repeat protein